MPSEDDKNVFLQSLQQEQEPSESPENDDAPKKKKKGMSGTALFATLFLLFLLVLTLLIFILSVGGAQNPILRSFGIESGEIKQFLKSLINWTFGALVIVQLVLFSVGLFRGFSAKKEEKQKRRKSLIFGSVCGGLIFAVVLAWLGMFAYIDRLPAAAVDNGNRIEVLNIEPGEKIVAPITISFSAEGIETTLRNRGERIERFRWSKNSENYSIDSGRDPRVDLIFREKGRQVVGLQVELEDATPVTFDIEFEIDEVVFSAEPDSGEVPLTVEFDARDVTQDLAVKTFEWDFDGDGEYDASSASSKIAHVYEEIGNFTVNLRVIMQDDQVRSFERQIAITGSTTDRIKAMIDASPKEGTAPLRVNFSAKNSFSTETEIIGYYWDFGDNANQLRGDTVSYTFDEPGNYRVELQVINNQDLIDTATVEIMVTEQNAAPTIQLRTEPQMSSQNTIVAEVSPLTVRFDATKTVDAEDDIVSFEWDFDADGEADDFGEEVTHTFEEVGSFPVTLTVTDASGNVSTKELTITTKKEAIQAVVSANPETGSVPLTIDFDGSQSSCGRDCRILSYEWNFGDGTAPQITGAHTTHTFSKVGTFTVNLVITTDEGEKATGKKIIAVRVPPLKACFTASRLSGQAPLTVTFKDCSAGTISSWKWDFGDGVVSEDRVAEHVFQRPGTYTVILSVTDENSTTSQTSQVITVE